MVAEVRPYCAIEGRDRHGSRSKVRRPRLARPPGARQVRNLARRLTRSVLQPLVVRDDKNAARSAGMIQRGSDTRLAFVVSRWLGRSVGAWDPA